AESAYKKERMSKDAFDSKKVESSRKLKYEKSFLASEKQLYVRQLDNEILAKEKFPDDKVTSVEAGGKKYQGENIKEGLDAFITDEIKKHAADKTKDVSSAISSIPFKINDVPFYIEFETFKDFKNGELVKHYKMFYTSDILTEKYEVPSQSAVGLLASARSRVQDIKDAPIETKRRITQSEGNIKQLEKDIEAKYDDTKLKALEDKLEGLIAKLKEESDENKKKFKEEQKQSGAETAKEL